MESDMINSCSESGFVDELKRKMKIRRQGWWQGCDQIQIIFWRVSGIS
jgi:hypothetical protein